MERKEKRLTAIEGGKVEKTNKKPPKSGMYMWFKEEWIPLNICLFCGVTEDEKLVTTFHDCNAFEMCTLSKMLQLVVASRVNHYAKNGHEGSETNKCILSVDGEITLYDHAIIASQTNTHSDPIISIQSNEIEKIALLFIHLENQVNQRVASFVHPF